MTPKPLDFEAARADLRGKIATNDGALAKVRDQLGALALDVTLGNVAKSELDAANAEHARLASNGESLTRALAEVDRREAARQEEDAAAERKRDEADHALLLAKMQAAGAEAVAIVEKLAAAVEEAVAAEREALRIAARLGITQRASVQHDLAELVVAKLDCLRPLPPVVLKPNRDEAAARLSAVS
jgi:hypothetical protein